MMVVPVVTGAMVTSEGSPMNQLLLLAQVSDLSWLCPGGGPGTWPGFSFPTWPLKELDLGIVGGFSSSDTVYGLHPVWNYLGTSFLLDQMGLEPLPLRGSGWESPSQRRWGLGSLSQVGSGLPLPLGSPFLCWPSLVSECWA